MERVKRWWTAVFRKDELNDALKTIPIYFVFFFVLNYAIGTGYLGVPFVFYHSGIITAVLTLLVMFVLCYAGAMWWIETIARAQALETWRKEKEERLFKTGSITGGDGLLLPKFEITLQRKFEPIELCKIFFGIYGQYSYLIMLMINSILMCWACATVAGSSLASNIPYNFGSLERCEDSEFHHRAIPNDGCRHSYRFSVFLYAVAVIPLCFLELSEQRHVQMLLGAMRFLIIGSMSLYSVIHLFGEDDYPTNYPVDCSNGTDNCDPNEVLEDYDYWHEVSRFGLKGWVTAIPVVYYGAMMHASISKLTHPIKEKKYLREFMLTLCTTSGVLLLVIGVTMALWFKKDTEETCTLNFVYTAHHGSSTALRVFSYFVLLSPVPDVYSAYPLVVIVTKDNLFMALTGHDSVTGNRANEEYRTRVKKKVIQVTLSLIITIVPLIGSFLVANLVDVVRYGGLLGFFMGCFFPAAVQLKSQYECNKVFCEAVEQFQNENKLPVKTENGKDESTPLIPEFTEIKYFDWKNPCYTTPYENWFSHPYMVVLMSLLGAVAFCLAIVSLPIRVHQDD